MALATLFKRTFTRYLDSDGNRVSKDAPDARKVKERSNDWYGRYRDAERTVRTVRLCSNKTAARTMLNELVQKAELQATGHGDRFEEHHKRPLREHVDDFEAHLQGKGNTASYVELTVQRIKAITSGCKFKRIGDISASAVSSWLKDRRAQDGMRDSKGKLIRFGIASSNHHLTAIMAFTRWLVKDRRTNQDRLSHLSRLNQATDVRRQRRHLTIEDFSKLIEATRTNGEHAGMSGPDRAMLYAVAGYTGLRASELASLTAESFDLSPEGLTVTVEAAYSKHRREDVLPLHPDLVSALRSWLKERSQSITDDSSPILAFKADPEASQAAHRLWPGKWAAARHGAKMLRRDLQAAKIDIEDQKGRVFDFHALRHQFISMLAAAGVHPKTAQELARHSDINLTMSRYTHVCLSDLSSAVESLPSLKRPEAQAATGTDGRGDSLVTQMVTLFPDNQGKSVRPIERRDGNGTGPKMTAPKTQQTAGLLRSEGDCDGLSEPECERQESNLHTRRYWNLNPDLMSFIHIETTLT